MFIREEILDDSTRHITSNKNHTTPYGVTQIKASAGSGKTYTLTQRFLHKLKDIAIPDTYNTYKATPLKNIIAMTFTNKAVAELKSAVLKGLKEAALLHEHEALTPLQASMWMNTLLEHYNALRIQSIDSTLLQLLHSIALPLGLPHNCKPLLDIDEEYLLENIYSLYMQQASHNPQDIETIRKACKTLVRNHAHSSSLQKTLKKNTIGLVKILLSQQTIFTSHEHRETIITAYEDYIAYLDTNYGPKQQEQNFLTIINNIQEAIKEHAITGLQQHFLNAINNPSYKKDSATFKKDSFFQVLKKDGQKSITPEVLSIMEYHYTQLKENVRFREAVLPSITTAITSAPIVRIACTLIGMLQEYQKKEGAILFSSVPFLLSEHFTTSQGVYDALIHFGTDINTIFFDEFQDTSTMQWQALYPIINHALDNEGSFIYVGDVKQAIYSWRGGDSSLFESITLSFQHPTYKETLMYNWRSAEPIVMLANIFSEIEHHNHASSFLQSLLTKNTIEAIQKNPSILEEGITKLKEGYAKGKQAIPEKTAHMKGKIRILELAPQDDPKDDEKEDIIAQILHQSLSEQLSHTPASNIAILTRTNKEARCISEWCLLWNIPYTIEGGVHLYSVPLVQHIILMLRFIQNPTTATLYAVLSSLLCRDFLLTEKECIEWRASIQNNPENALSLTSFKKIYPHLWATYFAPFIKECPTYTPYQYIQECIRRFALYERFPQHSTYLDTLLEVAFSTDAKKATTISDFLNYFEQYKDNHTVTPSAHTEAIQILSIHKSKGLEFPIVYIPFTKAPRTPHTQELALYPIHDIAIESPQLMHDIAELPNIPLITTISSSHTLYYKEKINTAIEQINLLYVALTRAKEELHMIIHSSEESLPEFSLSQSIQYILTDADLSTKHKITRTVTTPEYTVYEYSTLEDIQHSTLERVQQKPQEEPPLPVTPSSTHYDIVQLPPFNMEHIPTTHLSASMPDLFITKHHTHSEHLERGIILHLALEYIAKGFSLDLALEKACATPPQRQKYYEDLSTRIGWFLKKDISKVCLKEGLSEQRIITRGGEEKRVDSIIEYPNEWIVVEYKTGTFYTEHHAQVREYIKALQQIKNKPARAIIIYFDPQEEVIQESESISYYIYPM